MDKNNLSIVFSGYMNLQNFEKLLSAHFRKSLGFSRVEFNLSDLEWIGVLQVSILYGWIRDLVDRNIEVTIKVPTRKNDSQAVSFLTSINFFEELKKWNVFLSGKLAQSEPYGLAAFKSFENENELFSYEEALNKPNSAIHLLGGGIDVDLIRDGDLREIILHEVGQNAFIHGEGRNVRYAVSGYPLSSSRKAHKILSKFGGKSYIEVVVSDSGAGLLTTLKSAVPDDYSPNATVKNKKLSIGAKTIAYAFEFSSTSDEEGRKARLSKIYKEGGDVTQAIPTGLFYVATLAALYGGQIIIRSDNLITSLDFSTSSKMEIYSESTLVTLKGTHILFRFPRDRDYKSIAPVKRQLPTLFGPNRGNFVSIHLGKIRTDLTSDEDFLIKAEREILKNIQYNHKSRDLIIVLLGDGLRIDTKAFSLLLIILAIIPRRECAVLFLGLRDELVDSSLKQWEKIKLIRDNRSRLLDRVHGFKSFILTGVDMGKIIEFGDNSHPGSTIYKSDGQPNSYLEFNSENIANLYEISLKTEIVKLIEGPQVKHPVGYYYLIENKYYTRDFYEIGKVILSESGKELSLNYFRILLRKYSIKVIFTISEPLRKFTEYLEKAITGIRYFQRNPESERQSFLRAIADKDMGAKLLILTDVICRANEIDRFLSMVPNLDEIIVACFVDGRNEDFPYYTVKREDNPYKVTINSILKKKITPIYDLPRKPDLKILIIDSETHAPTSYDRIEKTVFQPDRLIEKATEIDAFFHGHFSFNGRHYTDFMNFPRLFKGLLSELHERWNSILENFKERKINNNDITVFYFNELEGWECLVENYMSTKGVKGCGPITRQQLDAPPDPKEKLKAIWFILPAIASGNTTMKCLEYGSRYDPERMHISIILARLDSSHLSFYQNITGYRNCNVEIEMLGWLPITAYSDISSCPLCAAEKIIDEILRKTEGYDYLSSIAKVGKELFKCIKVELLDFSPGGIPPATVEGRRIASIRNDYEEARRSIPHRKEKLGPLLSNQDSARCFIEMIGSDYLFEGFSEKEVHRVTYNRYENIQKEAARCIDNASGEGLSLRIIFGIHRLFPDMLLRSYKKLIHQATSAGNQQLFENLILLALIEPERYGVCVAGMTEIDIGENWCKKLMEEIRTYPHWYNTESTYAVAEFLKLLWLLRRSTTWGSNLESLRSYISIKGSTFEEIKKVFSVFESQGVKDVFHCINQLKDRENRNPGGLWSAILTEGRGVTSTIQKVEGIIKELTLLIDSSDETSRNKLLSLVEKLDNTGRELTSQLNYLFTNPIDVKLKIIELNPKRWPHLNIDIDFSFAEDQPGILFGLEDLIRSINFIIENAVDCVNEHIVSNGSSQNKFWLKFDFAGYTTDKLASIMLVKDNLPWKRELAPSGGLKQFIGYCKKYAAIYEFSPMNGDSEDVKIKVIFRIDDRRERHDYK